MCVLDSGRWTVNGSGRTQRNDNVSEGEDLVIEKWGGWVYETDS